MTISSNIQTKINKHNHNWKNKKIEQDDDDDDEITNQSARAGK